MSEREKDPPKVIVPTESPMPVYDYQKPEYGSYAIEYPKEGEKPREVEAAPSLGNIHFTLPT